MAGMAWKTAKTGNTEKMGNQMENTVVVGQGQKLSKNGPKMEGKMEKKTPSKIRS